MITKMGPYLYSSSLSWLQVLIAAKSTGFFRSICTLYLDASTVLLRMSSHGTRLEPAAPSRGTPIPGLAQVIDVHSILHMQEAVLRKPIASSRHLLYGT